MLIANSQVGHLGIRRNGRAELFEQGSGAGRHCALVEPAEPSAPGFFAAQEDVVGDGELWNQIELLVDDPDTGVFGLARAENRTGCPLNWISPSKSVIAPARIFMSVLLPAPFSPQMA